MNTHSYSFDFAMVFCPRWDTRSPWIAPACLLEAVRGAGFSAQFLDYNIRFSKENLSTENIIREIDIKEINAPIVGFSLTETNLQFSIELARLIKKEDPNKIILFGGHRIFFEEEPGEQVPLDACDGIVKGEGEITLIDILKNGLNGNLGTYTQKEGKWIFNGERELIKNLDEFPWPRYEDVDWEKYPVKSIRIMGSRGCIYRCAFCNDVMRFNHRFRKRSAENIAEEMLFHKENNHMKYFYFNDPILNADYRHLDKLCDLLLKNNFDRLWRGNFSIRGNMPKELIRKAKRTGLDFAYVGLESGSPKVLKLMKKGFDLEEAEWFLSAMHEVGIKVEINVIVGFPGETEEDFQQTLQFITKIAPKLEKINSVSTLNLVHSYIWSHLDEYNIKKIGKDRHISWFTRDGLNNYQVRREWAERLLSHAKNLGIFHSIDDFENKKKSTKM